MKRYFLITCLRGHAGTGHSTDITFAQEAENLIRAMDMVKRMPSVKHTRCILSGKEITAAEYNNYRKVSAYKRANGFF